MNIHQQSAIDIHKADLCEALQYTADAFLSRLAVTDIIEFSERNVIDSHVVKTDKILQTLQILKHKDGGFTALITYLRKKQMLSLADMLESAAEPNKQVTTTTSYQFIAKTNSSGFPANRMNLAQQSAMDSHHSELCEALQGSVKSFLYNLQISSLLNNDEKLILQRLTLDQNKVIEALNILRHKDGGLKFLVNYLRKNKVSNLADKLDSAEATTKLTHSTMGTDLPDQNNNWNVVVEEFNAKVIDFYLGNFRAVESFGGEEETIESVWINVHLEKIFSSSDDYDEIFVQMTRSNCRIAVVKGQPGSGKTILVKKIAYDWAKLKSEKKLGATRFDIILAVPLRSIYSGSDPLKIAVSYLLNNDSSAAGHHEAERVSAALRDSNLKILVILDGLDEYKFEPNSVLARMFSSAFTPIHDKHNISPNQFKYHLLVTSRPYACQTVNENLLVHKWEITGFTEERQRDFVLLRCKTPEGKKRAIKYLENSAVLSEISQIPLLLLLVCFLSDRNVDIPINLTRLYETFLLQMFIRFAKKGSTFDYQNWHKSELVTNLGSLAVMGVIKNKFQFSSEEMDMCGVGQDCFASGLLLFRSDPLSLATKADFPHRSIQEFLAALYSVNFWPTTSTISTSMTAWPKQIWPVEGISEMTLEMLAAKMIYFGDSQFCRFYFGLLSGRPQFEVEIGKSLQENLDLYLIDSQFLFCLSNSLADCSDSECFVTGRILSSLVSGSSNWIKSDRTKVRVRKREIFLWTEEKRMTEWPLPKTTEFRPQLESGLKLKWLKSSLPHSFYLRSEIQTEAKMLKIRLDEDNLVQNFGDLSGIKEVEWLFVDQSGVLDSEKLTSALKMIKLLPKCRNCRIADNSAEYFLILLWLGRKFDERKTVPFNSGHYGSNLEFLSLRVETNLGHNIFKKLQSLKRLNSSEVEIQSIQRSAKHRRIVRLAASNSWSVWEFLSIELQ